jgi:hypothetical protein
MTAEVLHSENVRRVKPVNPMTERLFFGGMALLMIGTVLLGFRRTYFALGARPSDLSSWVIQIHGIVFSLYLLLFLVQTALIAAHRVRWHMKLGLALYGLAAFMVPLGLLATAEQQRRGVAAGPPFALGLDPLTLSLVSVMGMVMFASLITLSWVARRRPDVHKRLVLYATLSMMFAGINRWPFHAWGVSLGAALFLWAPLIYGVLLLLPTAYDLASLRRIHWISLASAPSVWLLYRLSFPLGRTHAWHAVASLMLRFWH